MPISRIAYTTIACAAAVVLLAFAARAAEAPAPVPVVKLTGSLTPSRLPIPLGTPLNLHLHVRFSSNPPGADFVLQGVDFTINTSARLHGELFPSCSASRLRAANGYLRTCPKGSLIGSGTGSGRAVELGISATGRLTMYNGPAGKSITLNLSVVHPAQLNVTWSDPIAYLHGGRTIVLRERDPVQLQTVLGGDIDVTALNLDVGATRIVHGQRRGYIEAGRCHGSTLHTKYYFKGGATTTASIKSPC